MARHKPRRLPLDLGGLSGREDIFRLAGAAKRDPNIDAWFIQGPLELRSIAHKCFENVRRCRDDVLELMHDGCPVACVEDAAFAYVNSFKSHVNVGFFYGAALEDRAGLLVGSGKRMRHVKLHAGSEPNAAALRALIDSAYLDIRERLGPGRPDKK